MQTSVPWLRWVGHQCVYIRILKRKLNFLVRLMMHPDNSFISGKVFLSLREHGTEPLVVQQCRLLEQGYDTNHTSDLIKEANNTVYIKSVFKLLEQADQG